MFEIRRMLAKMRTELKTHRLTEVGRRQCASQVGARSAPLLCEPGLAVIAWIRAHTIARRMSERAPYCAPTGAAGVRREKDQLLAFSTCKAWLNNQALRAGTSSISCCSTEAAPGGWMIAQRTVDHSVQLSQPLIDLSDFGERFLCRHDQSLPMGRALCGRSSGIWQTISGAFSTH